MRLVMNALVVCLLSKFVSGEKVTKELWTLDQNQELHQQRRLSSRPFKNTRMERMEELDLFDFPMEVAASLEAGDKVSFQIPPSARLKKKAASGRAATPRPELKSCELIEGMVGVPKKIAPELKVFTCFPSEFEQFHLIINTEKENGIYATLQDSERNSFYIDPAFNDGETYTIYNSQSMVADELQNFDEFVNYTAHDALLEERALADRDPFRRLQTEQPNAFRFRLAIVVPSQTATDLGGTVASVSADFFAVMSRANGIISRELGVILELIEGFEAGICFDRNSVPCASVKNGIEQGDRNAAFLEKVGITEDRFDVGHSFHQKRSGGAAHFNVVCHSNPYFKAGGASDYSNRAHTTPDTFVVFMFAHQIGHQLGAGHTFRDCRDCKDCVDQRHSVEPGSGGMIMSYLGLCGPDRKLQSRGKDPYYNNLNQHDMRAALEEKVQTEPNCGSIVTTARVLPVVTAPGTCVVPVGNKFVLQGDSTAAVGENRFSSWDRVDVVTDSNASRFRSYKPVRARDRFFPNLHFLNFEIYPRAENLPSSSEIMKFRFTERREYRTDAHLDSFQESIMGDFVSAETEVYFASLERLEIIEPKSGATVPVDENFVVRWNPGDIPDISPDEKIQILFAENTMTATNNLADFDPETDLDALDWMLLIEANALDGEACVRLPEVSGDLSNIDGNLMIRASVHQNSSAMIDDASNCFVFDISTSIKLSDNEARNGSTTQECDLDNITSADDEIFELGKQEVLMMIAAAGMLGFIIIVIVCVKKIKRRRNERFTHRSHRLAKYMKTGSKPKPRDQLPPGGLLRMTSFKRKKRGLSLTNESFGKQKESRSAKMLRYTSASKSSSSFRKGFFSRKKRELNLGDEVAVSEGPKLHVKRRASVRVSRAFGRLARAFREVPRKPQQNHENIASITFASSNEQFQSWDSPNNNSTSQTRTLNSGNERSNNSHSKFNSHEPVMIEEGWPENMGNI